MVLNGTVGFLALLSFLLLLWQWIVAKRFPLRQRAPENPFTPGVSLLKPLKGHDEHTESCLRSWFQQQYKGPIQILFGVASADDPVCKVIERLVREFGETESRIARLVICGPLMGLNAKVSKLAQLEKLAKHDLLVISDADVKVAPDFLANFIAPFVESSAETTHVTGHAPSVTGLVNCFYRLANPTTIAMQWEAVAINADFWSQVLQARSLKPIDFALGAVMGIRKRQLCEIGGFETLADCLADDYQLGNRIARRGYRIEIANVPVECWSEPMGWREVWKHQLRWARTIRVSQPAPYFFSILSNATLWPALWMALRPATLSLTFGAVCFVARMVMATDLQRRIVQTRVDTDKHGSELDQQTTSHSGELLLYAWMPLVKDILQAAIWSLAFLGNRVEWRGEKLRLRPDGTLEAAKPRLNTN